MESMEIEVRVPILLQKLDDLLAHERNVYSRSTALVRMTETKPVLKSICKMIGGLEKGHASPDLARLRNGDFLNKLSKIENVIDTFIVKTELRRRNRFIEIMPPLIYLASLQDQIRLRIKMDKLTTYAKDRLSKVGIGESTTATNPHTTHAKGPLSEEEIPEPTNVTDLPATESKTVPYLHTTNAKGSLSEEEIVESTTATNLHTTYAEGRSSEEEITETTATELHALESETVPNLHTTNAKGRLYEEEIMESTTTTNPHTTHAKGRTTIEEIMKPGDSDFVGLEDKRDELLKKLFNSKGQESDNVITVTGNAGSGKTVLTKTIYNAPNVRRDFNHRAWVNVSEGFETQTILVDILRQLRWESTYENLPDNDLELRLKCFLKEKRCLVVVDNVRTPFDMEKLSVVLKCIGGWSRLILITRDINVACAANPRRNPIMLRSLTDDESWALFLKMIAGLNSPELINLRTEILKKCGGSPLQIILLGRLLSKKNLNEWSNVIKQLRNTNLSKSSTMTKDEQRQLSATNPRTTHAKGPLSEEEITEPTNATDLPATESKTVPDLHTTNAKGRLYEEEIMESTTTTNPHTTHAKGRTTIEEIMKPGDSDFVGLKDKRDELLEKLFYSKGQESDNVIAVTGNAGSGKTVLTKTIYNAPYVRRAFDRRAWVNVSEDFEAREILLNILRQLRWESTYENLPDNVLEQRLESFLKEKRCLVVVDDVRTPFDMEKLSVVLKCIGGWSRLILTTRDINVACAANPRRNPIMLRSLTDDESWALFLKMIAALNSPELINLRTEILKKCGGSPLQIILLGRLLSKKNENELSNFIKQLRNTNLSKSSTMIKVEHQQLSTRESPNVNEPAVPQSSTANFRDSSSVTGPVVQENAVQQPPTADSIDSSSVTGPEVQENAVQQPPTADSIDSSSVTGPEVQEDVYTLSYQDLSPRTKFCFLYFGLFPRAFKIPVRRLFHLWLAEGLLIPLPKEQNAPEEPEPEDLAEEYFNQLLSRNLIEVPDRDRRLDGSPKRCCMPGVIWDKFNPMAMNLGRFYEIRTPEGPANSPEIRRLVEKEFSKNHPLDIQNLRCYVSFYTRKLDLPIQEVRMFLKTIVTRRGFGLLIVLDLENVYKPMLSETLGKLLHLKYLGLRWTFLDSLPTSVGNLPYLETLDVKHTNIFALPSSIWKAKNLRHLYLNEIHIDMSVKKPNSQSLTNLKTLWGLSIGKESLVENCLTKLTGLRKLKLTCISESEFEAKWISQLSNLESLKLRSINEFGEPSTLTWETMAALDKLRDLYLLGQLPRAIVKDQFPSKLTILTLSASRIEEDPMQILGQLPELNILRLLRDSYTGKQMICEEFPKLRVLKLWMLNGLEEWIVKKGAMPGLRELEIRCCNQLNQPVGLELMEELEVILRNMPNGFAEKFEGGMVKANVKKVTYAP
ncbi:hypothetical protein ACB098_05G011600 [Castanea mollissima]